MLLTSAADLAICSSNIWLWWWTWGYVSLSNIYYSFVGIDDFIFATFAYAMLKTSRIIISILWVYLFCLSCSFFNLSLLVVYLYCFVVYFPSVVLTAQLLFLPVRNLQKNEVWDCCFHIFLKIELIPFLVGREKRDRGMLIRILKMRTKT